MRTITILIPIYNNASTLKYLCDKIQLSINQFVDFDIKILLVDDASTDNSFDLMLALKQKYQNISLLQLSYNHTQQYSFFAAIHYITTDYVIYLSADIQEELEVIEKYLVELKHDENTDLFLGFRQENNDFLIFKILSKIFYKLIRIKIPKMPEGGFDTGFAKISVVEKFKQKFKSRDLVQATLVSCADSIKLVSYTRQKSSSENIKIKSLIFKIKYFILSLISVYSNKKNNRDVSFLVKQYIP